MASDHFVLCIGLLPFATNYATSSLLPNSTFEPIAYYETLLLLEPTTTIAPVTNNNMTIASNK